jgi:hypothetical protein
LLYENFVVHSLKKHVTAPIVVSETTEEREMSSESGQLPSGEIPSSTRLSAHLAERYFWHGVATLLALALLLYPW